MAGVAEKDKLNQLDEEELSKYHMMVKKAGLASDFCTEVKKAVLIDDDGRMIEEVTYASMPIRNEDVHHLLKCWPVVKSALDEYGFSCEMTLVEGFVAFSTPSKIRDSSYIIRWVRTVIMLKWAAAPVKQAIRVLDKNVFAIAIKIGDQEGGLCRKYEINKKDFLRRLKVLEGRKNESLKKLKSLTGCWIKLRDKSVVDAIGTPEGLKILERVLKDCIRNKMSPAKHIHMLQMMETNKEKIIKMLVDRTGYTSIMEASMIMKMPLYRGDDICTKFVEALRRIQDTDILEVIADKFTSSDSPEVHANTEVALCAIMRFAPHGLGAKISSLGFIRRLLQGALEDSQPISVLISSLSVCIYLFDTNRQSLKTNDDIIGQPTTHEIIVGILDNLANVLKLLDDSKPDNMMLTTYGKLQPPLGRHRLKVVEFISVLLAVESEAAEKKLINLGAVRKVIDLFFKYPYNNFLHHHVENIVVSCLESNTDSLVHHLLYECDLVGKILQAENNLTLEADSKMPTSPAEGKVPPRKGNIGYLTRISNKIIQLANNSSKILASLQENNEWTDWHINVLSKRNTVESVCQWMCGRPTLLQDVAEDNNLMLQEYN